MKPHTHPPDSYWTPGYSFIACTLSSRSSLITHPMLLPYWLSPASVVSRATWVLGIHGSFRVSHRSVFVIGHWRESGSLRVSVDHVGNNVQLSAPWKGEKKKKKSSHPVWLFPNEALDSPCYPGLMTAAWQERRRLCSTSFQMCCSVNIGFVPLFS